MDTLRLLGLQFFGFHGHEPWEHVTGRRFEVDVELAGDFGAAAASDRLEDAVDYRRVHAVARGVVEGERHDLIERVAGRLAEEMLAAFPVEAVTIRVTKPEAPIGGMNRAAQIELTRRRKEG